MSLGAVCFLALVRGISWFFDQMNDLGVGNPSPRLTICCRDKVDLCCSQTAIGDHLHRLCKKCGSRKNGLVATARPLSSSTIIFSFFYMVIIVVALFVRLLCRAPDPFAFLANVTSFVSGQRHVVPPCQRGQ